MRERKHYRWSWEDSRPVLVYTVTACGALIVEPNTKFMWKHRLVLKKNQPIEFGKLMDKSCAPLH